MSNTRIVQHVTDNPIVLADGDTLTDTEVYRGGASYGRVLFPCSLPMVRVIGRECAITKCVFVSD